MKSSRNNFINRLKKQKEDALDYIIDNYMPLVTAIARKILHAQSKQDIDECINDVFLSVWQKAAQFQGDSEDFRKWIGMITKYKAIDRYRQYEKRVAREQLDTALTEQPTNFTIEQRILELEKKNELLFALSQLATLDRDIFLMKYYLELTNSEIAEALGLTKAAVDNRLYRGKKELAQYDNLKERFI